MESTDEHFNLVVPLFPARPWSLLGVCVDLVDELVESHLIEIVTRGAVGQIGTACNAVPPHKTITSTAEYCGIGVGFGDGYGDGKVICFLLWRRSGAFGRPPRGGLVAWRVRILRNLLGMVAS